MSEDLRYSARQRLQYLAMTDRLGRAWLTVFAGNTDFYSAAYWDLLTALWRRAEPLRKTDALKAMTAIKSAHTAGKYLQEALDQGLIVEAENPEDARSKLVELSPDMRRRLDRFFDGAVEEVRRAAQAIDTEAIDTEGTDPAGS